MHFKSLFALASIAVAFLRVVAQAGDTRYVAMCGNDSWTGKSPDCAAPDGPKRKIQAAIDAAADGDEIVVAAGKYQGNIDFHGKAVYLRSAEGPESTIIDGFTGSTVMCSSSEGPETVLEGLTISGGTGALRGSDRYGGGVYIDGSNPTIRDCIIFDNTAGYGGGLYIESSNPTVRNCTFRANAGGWGGGIANVNAAPLVIDCAFIDNHARDGANGSAGGGIYNSASNSLIVDCSFEDNGTHGPGGAVWSGDGSSAVLIDCFFRRNGGTSGGAISGSGSVTAENCVFEENEAASDGGGRGGAVSVSNAQGLFVDCTFTRNRTNDMGSQAGGAVFNSEGDVTLIRCGFFGNYCEFDGGVIYNIYGGSLSMSQCVMAGNPAVGITIAGSAVTVSGSVFAVNAIYNYNDSFDPPVTVTDCIFWGDPRSGFISGDPVTVTYTDVEGGYEGEGNIDADPRFVRDPDPGPDHDWGTEDDDYGDLRLQADSPCIDAGDPNYIASPGETDFDGLFRVWDGNADGAAVVDMGAYEFGSHPYADLNCDGSVDFDDIDAFVTALFGRDDYESLYPDCQHLLADINADGSVDFTDIDGFVDCLINGGCP